MSDYLYEFPDPQLGRHLIGFDYVSEADLTASGTFNPEQVGVRELLIALEDVIEAAENMDMLKKALFRKRTRDEIGLTPLPSSDQTLAYAIGPIGNYDDLFHGVIGGITEMGELAEVLRDYVRDRKEPDMVNVREEIGDVLWYITRLVKWAQTSFLTEMKRNIGKLRTRHGAAGFNKERDGERNLANERRFLEDKS